jgi:hypothetical protein
VRHAVKDASAFELYEIRLGPLGQIIELGRPWVVGFMSFLESHLFKRGAGTKVATSFRNTL